MSNPTFTFCPIQSFKGSAEPCHKMCAWFDHKAGRCEIPHLMVKTMLSIKDNTKAIIDLTEQMNNITIDLPGGNYDPETETGKHGLSD